MHLIIWLAATPFTGRRLGRQKNMIWWDTVTGKTSQLKSTWNQTDSIYIQYISMHSIPNSMKVLAPSHKYSPFLIHPSNQLATLYFTVQKFGMGKNILCFWKKSLMLYEVSYVKCTLQRWHRSASEVALGAFQRLFNAAQRWHEFIYTKIAPLYSMVMLGTEVGQSRHNLVWLLCSITS